jgi:hypothetical protein
MECMIPPRVFVRYGETTFRVNAVTSWQRAHEEEFQADCEMSMLTLVASEFRRKSVLSSDVDVTSCERYRIMIKVLTNNANHAIRYIILFHLIDQLAQNDFQVRRSAQDADDGLAERVELA